MLEHAGASDEDSVMRAVDGGLLRGLQGGTPSSAFDNSRAMLRPYVRKADACLSQSESMTGTLSEKLPEVRSRASALAIATPSKPTLAI
jgi:hypothetical protein